jgi:hypothetical protein
VQDGEEADLGAEVPGVGGNRAEGLGGCLEQQAIEERFVLQGDRGYLLRQCEDNVEVLGVEQLSLAVLYPLRTVERLAFWAVAIPAAVVADLRVAATRLITDLDMSSEDGSAALLNGLHGAPLRGGQPICVSVTKRIAVTVEDIRHLDLGAIHDRSGTA